MLRQSSRLLLSEALRQHDITPPRTPPTSPLNTKAQEAEECEIYEMQSRRHKLALDLEDHGKRIGNRHKYTSRLYWLMFGWMVAVLLILVLNATLGPHPDRQVGAARCPIYFTLPDTVLLALVGGTTANVIGLFLVVAKYLFPPHKADDE